MKKKILSLLLAVVMLTSILPMSAINALAKSYTVSSGSIYTQNLKLGDTIAKGVTVKGQAQAILYVNGQRTNGNIATYTTERCYRVAEYNFSMSPSLSYCKIVTDCSMSSATCQSPSKCADCGYTSGSALGHNYTNYRDGGKVSDATCTTAETHKKMCSRCSTTSGTYTKGSALGHTYTKQGSKVSDATVDSPAVYNKQCVRCTATSGTMQVGDKLPSAYVNYVDPSTGETVEKEATNDTVAGVVDELLSKPMQNNKKGIFLGWFADGTPLAKGTSRFDALTDITAGYTPVMQIEKDFNDDKMIDSYKSFGLAGVQIREDNTQEHFEEGEDKLEGDVYGGLRYVASFSEQLKSIVENNANVEYGFVMASKANAEMFADHYGVAYDKYEIKYNTGVNGGTADTDYRYVTNVVCSNNIDHRNFDGYRLFTAVIDYEGAESLKDTEFVARAYVKYVDANGNTQIYYDDYDGTTTFGGCSVSYNQALAM